MAQPFKRRLLTKKALVISLSGPTAGATQIFNYDLIREVRLDLEKFEVQILMTYDPAYFKVFDLGVSHVEEKDKEKYKTLVLKFYNDLVTAAMKLSKEEVEEMKKQSEEMKKKMQENAQNQAQNKPE